MRAKIFFLREAQTAREQQKVQKATRESKQEAQKAAKKIEAGRKNSKSFTDNGEMENRIKKIEAGVQVYDRHQVFPQRLPKTKEREASKRFP